MSKFDRYLLRQFIRTFLICYVSLAGLYVVFDAFTNLEEFIKAADKAGNLLVMMGTHYGFQSILFFDRASGVLALIAAMFTVTWIQRHNELVAMESAGVSRIRMVVPIICAVIAITALSVGSREFLIPRFRHELSRRPQDMAGNVAQALAPRYDNLTDVLIRGDSTFTDQQRIKSPDFLLPPSMEHFGQQVMAENAYYQPAQAGRPGGYLMDGVTAPEDINSKPSLTKNNLPVIITPSDAPGWLKQNQCFLVSEVPFEQLAAGRAWRQFSSTRQLIDGLWNDSLGFGADVRVAIHSRMVQPFLDTVLLFLGLPLVLSRQSRNVFIAMGLCLVVVAVFSLVVIGCQYLGTIYAIRPALAAWAPMILFVPMAVATAETMWD